MITLNPDYNRKPLCDEFSLENTSEFNSDLTALCFFIVSWKSKKMHIY